MDEDVPDDVLCEVFVRSSNVFDCYSSMHCATVCTWKLQWTNEYCSGWRWMADVSKASYELCMKRLKRT